MSSQIILRDKGYSCLHIQVIIYLVVLVRQYRLTPDVKLSAMDGDESSSLTHSDESFTLQFNEEYTHLLV